MLPSPHVAAAHRRRRLGALSLIASIVGPFLGAAAPAGAAVIATAPANSGTAHVTAALLPEGDWIQPARTFTVALQLRMAPGWHTYWKNPGDSGLPTRITWALPPGFRPGPIQWPAPARLVAGPLASYGYEDQVLLLTDIEAPKSLAPGQPVRLPARIDWLECEEACLPGRAQLELTLPVRAEAAPPRRETAAAFAEARRRLPRDASGWKVEADFDGPALLITPPRGTALAEGVLFLSELPRVIEYAASQKLVRRGEAYRLELMPDANAARPHPGLVGVLLLEGRGGRAAPHAVRVELKPRTTSRLDRTVRRLSTHGGET